MLAGGADPDPEQGLILDLTIEQAGLPPLDDTNLRRWRAAALARLLVTLRPDQATSARYDRNREQDRRGMPMQNRAEESAARGLSSRSATLRFVILLGFVSLFGDMVYEGARSITGPYLALLGASAKVVGVVAGLGELVSYGLRLVSGYISDRTRRYWAITLLGYGLTVVAVPLLAIAGS